MKLFLFLLALFAIASVLYALCGALLSRRHPMAATLRFVQGLLLLAAFCSATSQYFSATSSMLMHFAIFLAQAFTISGGIYCVSDSYIALKQLFPRHASRPSEP
jgi:predicted membrane protein